MMILSVQLKISDNHLDYLSAVIDKQVSMLNAFNKAKDRLFDYRICGKH